MEDIEELKDLGTGMTVISIVIDKAKDAPEIDLGDCPPVLAISIFQQAIEALEQIMPIPTITYNGSVIASEITYVMLEDDDDEDWQFSSKQSLHNPGTLDGVQSISPQLAQPSSSYSQSFSSAIEVQI